MRMFKYRKPGILLCFLCILLTVHAEYTVSGGKGTPLLAEDDTRNDIQVYLVYGMENVSISYISPATNLQWYRFKTKALEAEPIESFQEGNTSVIRGIEEGYGYYVEEPGKINKYIWLIDYSKYLFKMDQLTIDDTDDPCSGIRLRGEPSIPIMSYNLP